MGWEKSNNEETLAGFSWGKAYFCLPSSNSPIACDILCVCQTEAEKINTQV